MKKIIIPVILVSILLVSCTAGVDSERFFDYQKKDLSVAGKWTENSAEYGVVLTMSAPGEKDGVRKFMKIEFTSPETVAGTAYVFEDGELTAALGDMTVPVNAENAEKVFRIAEMFSLKSEDIRNISVDKDGKTVAVGKGWEVTTGEKGKPVRIVTENSSLDIDKFEG